MNRKRFRIALPAAVTFLLLTELVSAHHGNAGSTGKVAKKELKARVEMGGLG